MYGLNTFDDIDIRELSETYDTKDVYVSVYLPILKNVGKYQEGFLEQRQKDILKVIKKSELEKNFLATMDMVYKEIKNGPARGELSRIIFASAKEDYLRSYRLPLEIDGLVVLDTSPYIKPLALLRDDWYDYGVLFIDHECVRIYTISTQMVADKKKYCIDLMNKHKKGGQSQMRFQRLRDGAIHAFMGRVAEDMREAFRDKDDYWRGIIIAGPGNAKKELMDNLPQDLKKEVISLVDADMDSSIHRALEIGESESEEDEARRGLAHIEALKAAVYKGQGGLYGLEEVTTAARDGRVSVLLLDRDVSARGWICENCQMVEKGNNKEGECPYCGGPISAVDVVEEIIEFAERTDAEIEFVRDNPFLQSIGGIGALLRY